MKTTVEISDPLLRGVCELAALRRQRVAALCRHGVREIGSAGRAFSRFSGFPVVNPSFVGLRSDGVR